MPRILLFIVAVLSIAGVHADEAAYIEHVQKAYQYSLSGMKDKAIAEFEEAVKLVPADADLHLKIAELQGCPGGNEHLRKAIAIADTNWRAYAKLGECLLQQGEMEQGRTLVEKALTLNATDIDLRLMAGHWSMEMKEYDNALAHYGAVLEKDEDNFKAMQSLGLALMKLGRHEEAEKILKQASALDPANPEPFIYMSESQRASEQGATACISLETGASLALELDPSAPEITRNMIKHLEDYCPQSRAIAPLRKTL